MDIDTEAGDGIQLIDEARAHSPIGVIALTRRSDLRGMLDAFDWHKPRYIESVPGAGYRFVSVSDPKRTRPA